MSEETRNPGMEINGASPEGIGGEPLSDAELENTAGGYRRCLPLVYRCPECGKTKTMEYDWEFGPHAPYCTKCSVQMLRIS